MSSDNGGSSDDYRVESVLGLLISQEYKLEVFIIYLGAERLCFQVFPHFSSFCIEDGSQSVSPFLQTPELTVMQITFYLVKAVWICYLKFLHMIFPYVCFSSTFYSFVNPHSLTCIIY